MIIERTHYFAKPGQRDAVLAIRRKACDVRVAIGLPAGSIRVKADASGDGPDVAWECAFPSKQAHQADLDARAASLDFEAVRAHHARRHRPLRATVRGTRGRRRGLGRRHRRVGAHLRAHRARVHQRAAQTPGISLCAAGRRPLPLHALQPWQRPGGWPRGQRDAGHCRVAELLGAFACFYPHRRGYGFSPGPHWRSDCPAPEFQPGVQRPNWCSA
jgi:hypothetical protein